MGIYHSRGSPSPAESRVDFADSVNRGLECWRKLTNVSLEYDPWHNPRTGKLA
jgi:hypothetical protein